MLLVTFPLADFMNTCRNLPIKGASPNKALSLEEPNAIINGENPHSLIVRFSIRNHPWKAENLSFLVNLSDLTLLERLADYGVIIPYTPHVIHFD